MSGMTSTPLQDDDWATVEPVTDDEGNVTLGQRASSTQETASAVEITQTSETPVGSVIEISDLPEATSTDSQEIVPPSPHSAPITDIYFTNMTMNFDYLLENQPTASITSHTTCSQLELL